MIPIQSQAELLENFRKFSELHTKSYGYVADREIFEADYQTCFELRRLIRNKQFLTEDEFLEFIEIFNRLQWKGLECFGSNNPLSQLAGHFNYVIKNIHNESPDRYWRATLTKIDSTKKLIDEIKNQRVFFINMNFTEEGFDFEEQNLVNMAIFTNCTFTVSFRKAKLESVLFIQCNLKTCDFIEADLGNAVIEECLIDATEFKNANIHKMTFHKNYIQSAIVNEEYLFDFQCIGESKQTLNN